MENEVLFRDTSDILPLEELYVDHEKTRSNIYTEVPAAKYVACPEDIWKPDDKPPDEDDVMAIRVRSPYCHAGTLLAAAARPATPGRRRQSAARRSDWPVSSRCDCRLCRHCRRSCHKPSLPLPRPLLTAHYEHLMAVCCGWSLLARVPPLPASTTCVDACSMHPPCPLRRLQRSLTCSCCGSRSG